MDLSDKSMQVAAEGQTITMTVASNVHYAVSHQCDWFTITETKSDNDLTTFTIEVIPNEDTTQRTGRIKFIGDGVTPKALDIVQRGIVPTGVSVKTLRVAATDTSSSFTVLGEGQWTASSSKPDFVLNPTEGEGQTAVTVTFPQNRTGNEIKATITVRIDGKSYNMNIIQEAPDLSIITEWAIKDNASQYANTWGNTNFDKTVEGFIKPYAEPTTGTGSIRFFNSDKSSRPDDGKGMRTQTGSNGDLLIRGCVSTDYWLLECGNEMLEEIPAGKEMRFEFTGHIYSSCAAHWMLEYLDGDQWKPMITPKTTTLTATEGLSGATGQWSENVTYNILYPIDGVYVLFEAKFTLQNPMPMVKIRLRPATEIACCMKYIDKISQSTCTRFTAQHPHNGTTAVKEYNQTVKLEFTK